MGADGYLVKIKKGGTSTSFSGEGMSVVLENKYQIDTIVKRVWDRDVEPIFYDNGEKIPSSDISVIDYLFGRVTFATSKSGTITVDGKYIPLTLIAGAKSYNLNQSRDVSLTISKYDDLTGAFMDIIRNRKAVLVEIQPGGKRDIARGWFVLDTDVEFSIEDLTFQLDASVKTSFNWGT